MWRVSAGCTTNYTYDNDGNQWTETPSGCAGGPSRTMQYDGANRLVWSSSFTGGPDNRTDTREFWYDALGRRILARTTADAGNGNPLDLGLWRYWWLDDHVAVKVHNQTQTPDSRWPTIQRVSGSVTGMGQWYYYGPGMDNPLASWGYFSPSGSGNFSTYQFLYVQDWRGSIVHVANEAGNLQGFGPDRYTTFGVGGGAGAPSLGPGYNGMEGNGGLVYMRNRWYDPNTGRFTQQDPIGFAGGTNLYGYVGNNPVMLKDPFGLAADTIRVIGAHANMVVSALRQQSSSFAALFDALHADPNVNLTIRDPQNARETHGMDSQFMPGSGGSSGILFNVNFMNQHNTDLAAKGSSWIHTAGSTMAHELAHAGGHYGKLDSSCRADPPTGTSPGGCAVAFENRVRQELGGKGGVRTEY